MFTRKHLVCSVARAPKIVQLKQHKRFNAPFTQSIYHYQFSSEKTTTTTSSEDDSARNSQQSSWWTKYLPKTWFEYSIVIVTGCVSTWFLHRYYYIHQAQQIDKLMSESEFLEASKLLETRIMSSDSRFTKGATAKLLECYSQLKDLSSAASLMVRMIDAFPEDSISNRMDLAYVYIHAQQFTKALEQLVAVIDTSPQVAAAVKSTFTQSTLPSVQRFLGLKDDAAASTLTNSIEKARVLDGVAAAFVYLNMYPEADLIYQMSLEANPASLETQYAYAAVRFTQDQLDSAESILENILKSKEVKQPLRIKTVFTLVDVYSVKKQYNKAVALCSAQVKAIGTQSPQFSLQICRSRIEAFKNTSN